MTRAIHSMPPTWPSGCRLRAVLAVGSRRCPCPHQRLPVAAGHADLHLRDPRHGLQPALRLRRANRDGSAGLLRHRRPTRSRCCSSRRACRRSLRCRRASCSARRGARRSASRCCGCARTIWRWRRCASASDLRRRGESLDRLHRRLRRLLLPPLTFGENDDGSHWTLYYVIARRDRRSCSLAELHRVEPSRSRAAGDPRRRDGGSALGINVWPRTSCACSCSSGPCRRRGHRASQWSAGRSTRAWASSRCS